MRPLRLLPSSPTARALWWAARLRRSAPWGLVAGVGLGGVALAAPVLADLDAEVATVEASALELDKRSRRMEQRVAPGAGTMSPDKAMRRYQDAVYNALIGNHQRAAEQFFALVTAGALKPFGLEWDAEWYLAESLFALGNVEIAEKTYLRILQEGGHPFRSDAVQRLLEIYAADLDPARFDALYAAEILSGKVKATDAVVYYVGKAFRTRKDVARATDYFGRIQVESPFYARARYQLGALLVAAGTEASVKAAMPYFDEASKLITTTETDRKVADLSMLALARIHYEFGEYDAAIAQYGRVGADSPLRAEQLHELVWTQVKKGDIPAAIEAVDTFLRAFPESRYAAELRLVRGHLLFEEDRLDDALAAYREVVTSYEPVQRRFGQLARATSGGAELFQQLLDIEEGTTQQSGEGGLPAFAVAVMLDDVEFAHAFGVHRELRVQERELAASQQIIADLDAAIGAGASASAIGTVRRDALLDQLTALEGRLALLQLGEGWLTRTAGSSGDSGVAAAVEGFSGDRRGLEARLMDARSGLMRGTSALRGKLDDLAALEASLADARRELDEARVAVETARVRGEADAVARLTADIATLEGRLRAIDAPAAEVTSALGALEAQAQPVFDAVRQGVEDLWNAQRDLAKRRGTEFDLEPVGARIGTTHALLDGAVGRLAGLEAIARDTGDSALARLRTTFRQEVLAVEEQRADLAGTRAEAELLAGGLVRDHLGQLEALFASNVLGADLGVVNVHWSELIKTNEAQEQAVDERQAAVAEIEQRFGALRARVKP